MDRVVGPEYKRLALEEPREGAGVAAAGAALINSFPNEVLERIFSSLDSSAIGNAAVVCSRWYIVLINKLKRELPLFDPIQSEVLLSISNKLVDIEYTTAAIQVARMIRGIYEQSMALQFACNKLIENAGTQLQAIDVAKTIPKEEIKIETLSWMHRTLLEMGNMDQARVVVAEMPDNVVKSNAYLDICKKYLEMGNMDQAQVVADMMVKKFDRSVALSYISKKYQENGNSSKAQEIADTIPNKDRKQAVLRELFLAN